LVLGPLLVAVGSRVGSGSPPCDPSIGGMNLDIWRQAVLS
jgi:hypothetical protein